MRKSILIDNEDTVIDLMAVFDWKRNELHDISLRHCKTIKDLKWPNLQKLYLRIK
jgi:hypothetical protein